MIRPADVLDIQAMVQLLQHLFSLEADFDFDEQRQTRGLMLLIESSNAIALVAEKQGKVQGMVTGQLVISTAEGGLSLLMEDLVVNPEYQELGLGSRLLHSLEAWAKRKYVSRMQLLADRDNSFALSFYAARSWQTTKLICLQKKIKCRQENKK